MARRSRCHVGCAKPEQLFQPAPRTGRLVYADSPFLGIGLGAYVAFVLSYSACVMFPLHKGVEAKHTLRSHRRITLSTILWERGRGREGKKKETEKKRKHLTCLTTSSSTSQEGFMKNERGELRNEAKKATFAGFGERGANSRVNKISKVGKSGKSTSEQKRKNARRPFPMSGRTSTLQHPTFLSQRAFVRTIKPVWLHLGPRSTRP